MKNRSYSITADVESPEGGANAMLMMRDGYFGGNALLLMDGKPTFLYARCHYPRTQIQGSGTGQTRRREAHNQSGLRLRWRCAGKGGNATVSVHGQEVAKGRIEQAVPVRVSADETLDIGAPIVRDYEAPFHITGEINKFVIDLK
jgi:hypothetical protein